MKEHVILLITNRQEEDIIVRHIMSKCNITEGYEGACDFINHK